MHHTPLKALDRRLIGAHALLFLRRTVRPKANLTVHRSGPSLRCKIAPHAHVIIPVLLDLIHGLSPLVFRRDPVRRWSGTPLSHMLLGLMVLAVFSGCFGLLRERVVYDQDGIRIGIQGDPSIDPSIPGGINSHPIRWTADQARAVLTSIQVSGYSGTIAGLFVTPEPIPLLTDEELQRLAQPIAVALSQAGPRERVFFSLPNLDKPYRRERTEGTLFVRGPLFYLSLSDHAAFIRTNTGGGDDERDPRDTKGMKLWVKPPLKPAIPPPEISPRWSPYEKVHIALPLRDALTPNTSLSLRGSAERPSHLPAAGAPRARHAPTGASPPSASETDQDLRLQIRELTSSNLELRERLEEQTKEMRTLKETLDRVQRDLEKATQKLLPRRQTPAGAP